MKITDLTGSEGYMYGLLDTIKGYLPLSSTITHTHDACIYSFLPISVKLHHKIYYLNKVSFKL